MKNNHFQTNMQRKQKNQQNMHNKCYTQCDRKNEPSFGSTAHRHQLFLTCIVSTESNHKYKTISEDGKHKMPDAMKMAEMKTTESENR